MPETLSGAFNSPVTVVTWNVLHDGFCRIDTRPETRAEAIVVEIKQADPQLIFLQEAFWPLVEALNNSCGPYFIATSCKELNESVKETVPRQDLVFQAILSKSELTEVAHVPGLHIDDGLLSCQTKIQGVACTLINAHAPGGSYGLSEQGRLQLQEERSSFVARVVELAEEQRKSGRVVFLGGDFNSDANNLEAYPELVTILSNDRSPLRDAWSLVRPGDPGNTESTKQNGMRKMMKPKQQREARFDLVLYYIPQAIPLVPTTAELLGMQPCKLEKSLWPSDHFGIRCTFSPVPPGA